MNEKQLPDESIETLARSFYKDSQDYGFHDNDYLRSANMLLDLSMKKRSTPQEQQREGVKNPVAAGGGEEVNPIELPLCGERVKIRPFEAERDFDLFTKWFANINGRYFLISRVTSHTASFNDLISNESNIIGVITLLDDSPIGSVTFLDYDRRQQKAELKKLVGQREKRGMGLAKEATKLWIEYGIRALGLKKIYLNTLFTNVRNIRLNEDLGFQVEGILRNEIFFEGKHYDVLRMGLWKD